nr:hypothetical protein [uncultured Campylobacter sp.]
MNFKRQISKLNLTGKIYPPNLKIKFGSGGLCALAVKFKSDTTTT